MGFVRTSILALVFAICFAFIYPLPLADLSDSVDNEKEIYPVDRTACSCGFYESIQDEEILPSDPLVNFQTDFIPCNFNGLIMCHDTCQSSSDLLMEKLCEEKEDWITKPGYINYQFCGSSQWINTENGIINDNSICCQNRSRINCSLIKDIVNNVTVATVNHNTVLLNKEHEENDINETTFVHFNHGFNISAQEDNEEAIGYHGFVAAVKVIKLKFGNHLSYNMFEDSNQTNDTYLKNEGINEDYSTDNYYETSPSNFFTETVTTHPDCIFTKCKPELHSIESVLIKKIHTCRKPLEFPVTGPTTDTFEVETGGDFQIKVVTEETTESVFASDLPVTGHLTDIFAVDTEGVFKNDEMSEPVFASELPITRHSTDIFAVEAEGVSQKEVVAEETTESVFASELPGTESSTDILGVEAEEIFQNEDVTEETTEPVFASELPGTVSSTDILAVQAEGNFQNEDVPEETTEPIFASEFPVTGSSTDI